ncbi:MAG: Hypothetical protein C75L2_00390020 [Leptospirillum sp. Group II 'C75']|uniref:Uncharacterized protein n=1 Tax=Leptospirillum sp. Group II '5-way CG' TaxID=419541 RepID=B6ARS8_9BACT|nr:MAG: hypothetical protein UBAL2_80490189 [Leptospirillum rubarum]EDZ38174.1 MAG: Hypothetical protein CGL2_09975004 [Leptospirillum sp. Group II '5-way CG']EIJ75974.1 MAG: Hypothetical protein C75L2_00390020 [Leptospirillum sp. Group II 'C75']
MAYIVRGGENRKRCFPVGRFPVTEVVGGSDGKEGRTAAGSFDPDRFAVFSVLPHVVGRLPH